MLRSLLAAAAVVAASLPMTASATLFHPQLGAKVTARSISLLDSKGKRVRLLQQNSYRIVVRDATKGQNFHLVGPGVNLRTKVATTGVRQWVVNLRPGIYTYSSDRRATLRGTFKVTDSPPPS